MDDYYIEVKPWSRFFARILDYIIFIWLSFILVEKLLHISLNGWFSFLFYLLLILLWIPVEAAFLSLFGATPGKWLFNVKIRDSEGKRLRFIPALARSIYTWFFGMALGIPGVFVFSMLKQYSSLTYQKGTSFDRKRNYGISHEYLRLFKTTLIVSVYVAAFIFLIIIPQLKASLELEKKMLQTGSGTGAFAVNEYAGYADNLNKEGYSLMNEGKYKEARETFLQGLHYNPDEETKDALYNNLSWACYNLEDYNEALNYSNLGLENGGDTYEYSNYANALAALGNTSEADKAYKRAIGLDSGNRFAHYGLGQLKYENSNYADAIQEFKAYTELKKDDAEGWCYLGLSYLYGDKGSQLKAKECLDSAVKIAPDSTFVISSMADYYEYINEPDEVEKLYEKALAGNSGNYDLLCEAAKHYQNKEDYEKALSYAERAISEDLRGTEAYRIKAQTYFWQGERQKAIDTMNRLTGQNSNDDDAFYTAADLYNSQYEYKLAVEAYDKALEINPLLENAVIGKLRALYSGKHYTECLEYAEKVENSFSNKEIPWYIGDVYSHLGDSEPALRYYLKALSMDDKDIALITSVGWEYYNSGDYTTAKLYAEKALAIDDSYGDAKELKDAAEKRQSNIADQITEFIEKNYMYYKSNAAYESLKNNLKSKKDVSMEDIRQLFDAVHKDGDRFSFFLSGEEYDKYLEYESRSTVEYKSLKNGVEYIRILNFSGHTANEFLDAINKIEEPANKYLVIDLRGNGGGVTTSGCDILDFLLPDSVVCNLIYKDGYSNPYYSDEDRVEFKHIFILVDENSASCSELVTLGLKTYLDNVTVIGRNTFGKGVGQIVFEDKERGFSVFIVNHFWNVREENISDKGIKPDIIMKGTSTDAYLKEINKQIGILEGVP